MSVIGRVYGIKLNEKIVYIGSTTLTLERRMSHHRSNAKLCPGRKLYRLMAEHGAEAFSITPLAEMIWQDEAFDINQLRQMEGGFIKIHRTVADGCNVQVAGRQRSEYREDERQKITDYKRRWRSERRAAGLPAP